MEDKGTEKILGVLLSAESNRTGPWIAYWVGVAFSFGFWAIFFMGMVEEGTPVGARLGMLVVALAFGATSWVGVGVAMAGIALTLMRGFGI